MGIGIVKRQTFCSPGVGLWWSLLLFPSHFFIPLLWIRYFHRWPLKWGSGRLGWDPRLDFWQSFSITPRNRISCICGLESPFPRQNIDPCCSNRLVSVPARSREQSGSYLLNTESGSRWILCYFLEDIQTSWQGGYCYLYVADKRAYAKRKWVSSKLPC